MTTWSSFLSGPPAFDTNTVTQLRSVAPEAKIMAAFGGWGFDQPFRPACATEETRKAFARNVADFVKLFDLDGADIDWE